MFAASRSSAPVRSSSRPVSCCSTALRKYAGTPVHSNSRLRWRGCRREPGDTSRRSSNEGASLLRRTGKHSTKAAYQSDIDNLIGPCWAETTLKRYQTNGCRGLVAESGTGSEMQEPRSKPDVYDFSVSGKVGADGQESGWFGLRAGRGGSRRCGYSLPISSNRCCPDP